MKTTYWVTWEDRFRISFSRLHRKKRTGIDYINDKSTFRLKFLIRGYFIHLIYWKN